MQTNLLWKAKQCLPGEGRRQEWKKDYQGETFEDMFIILITGMVLSSPGGSVVKKKNLHTNAGYSGYIPGWGRSPGKGNGNPLQYSCLENSMDRGAWWATVHGVAKS